MLPKNIPGDINIELLLSYFTEGTCKVAFKGLHKRNSYNDIIEVEERRDGSLLFGIGRNSLYNSLPEFMFHSVDRFDNIPKTEEKERFAEEYQKQEQEKENAYRFFEPLDLLLLKLRVSIREKLHEYVEHNKVLTVIIGDTLTEEQKSNRFIKHSLIFIPACKNIRGDKTLLTLMLRKIFMEEGLKTEKRRETILYTDSEPRYADGVGALLGDSYVGNTFDEDTTIYDIHYWSEDDCDEYFLKFIDDIELFRRFIQDYFIAIEETLHFNICKDDVPLRLSDDAVFNYLNFNTNI
ncbi:MAG: hypothetical protein J6Z14_11790 [Prevotella sp.]|nr:hypothetical protein [Prevotella sp.]